MGDMSSSMSVDETLSASTTYPVGYNVEAMSRISGKASCQTLYSTTENSFHEQNQIISNESQKIRIPKYDDELVIIYSRHKCPLKPHSATKACEISNQQLVILENQSNESCSRQVTKGLLADQNNRIKINCDGKQNNNNAIERTNETEMSSICWTERKGRQKSTIWNYDNCYHTCSFNNNNKNNNNNNIEYGNGGQNEKCSHSNNTELFCTSTTLLRSNECSTQTKTIAHHQYNVTSTNFLTLMMKNLLAPLFYILSVSSVMNNKLFVKSHLKVLLCMVMLLSSNVVYGSPMAGPGPLGASSGSSLQQGGGLLPFPEGKKRNLYFT